MGVMWTVWPLDKNMKDWLDECAVDYPNSTSRFPTGGEIKSAISSLGECNVKIVDNGIGGPWQASIVSGQGGETGEWALLNITKYTGDEQTQELYFEKGWESLIKRILRTLAEAAGPLVLISDAGDAPEVITYC